MATITLTCDAGHDFEWGGHPAPITCSVCGRTLAPCPSCYGLGHLSGGGSAITRRGLCGECHGSGYKWVWKTVPHAV